MTPCSLSLVVQVNTVWPALGQCKRAATGLCKRYFLFEKALGMPVYPNGLGGSERRIGAKWVWVGMGRADELYPLSDLLTREAGGWPKGVVFCFVAKKGFPQGVCHPRGFQELQNKKYLMPQKYVPAVADQYPTHKNKYNLYPGQFHKNNSVSAN